MGTLILIEPEFNNFFFLHHYLKRHITSKDTVVTNHRIVVAYIQLVHNQTAIFDDQHYSDKEYSKVILFSNSSNSKLFSDFTRFALKSIENINIFFSPDKLIVPHLGSVVHCCKKPFDIYMGREYKNFQKSIWFNPFPMHNEDEREMIIWKYTWYIINQPHLFKQIPSLKNKVLGCFCAPRLCHCDVLLWISDNVKFN